MIDITNEDIKKSYKQVKNELKNYSSKLSKKRELIVLNKVDLIDDKLAKEITKEFSNKINAEILTLSTLKKKSVSKVKDFSKNIKSEIIVLSTLEKKSISKIKSKLISYVS